MKSKIIKLSNYLKLNSFFAESDYIMKLAAYSKNDIEKDFPQLFSSFFPKDEVLDDAKTNMIGQVFRQLNAQIMQENISLQEALSLGGIDEIKSKLGEIREESKKFKNKKDLTEEMISFIRENGISKKDLDFVYNPDRRMNHQLFDALIEIPDLNSRLSRIKGSEIHRDLVENNIYDYPDFDEAYFNIRSIDRLVREGLSNTSSDKVKEKLEKYYDYIYAGKIHEGKDYSRYKESLKGRAKKTSKVLSYGDDYICVHSWSKEACQYWEQGAVKIRAEGPEFRTCTSRIRGVEGWTNRNLFDTYSDLYVFQIIKTPLRLDLSNPNDMVTICYDDSGTIYEYGGDTVNAENEDLDRNDIIKIFPNFEKLEVLIKERIGTVEEKYLETISLMRSGGDADYISELYSNYASIKPGVGQLMTSGTSENRDFLISFQNLLKSNEDFKKKVLLSIYPSKTDVLDEFSVMDRSDSLMAKIFHSPNAFLILGIREINEVYNQLFDDYLEYLKDFFLRSSGAIGSKSFLVIKKQLDSVYLNNKNEQVKDLINYFTEDINTFIKAAPSNYNDFDGYGFGDFLEEYFNFYSEPIKFFKERYTLKDILRQPKAFFLYMKGHDRECFLSFKKYILNEDIEDDWKVVDTFLSSYDSEMLQSFKVFLENEKDAINFLNDNPALCYQVYEKNTEMSRYMKKTFGINIDHEGIKNTIDKNMRYFLKRKYTEYIQPSIDQINSAFLRSDIDKLAEDYSENLIQISSIEDMKSVANKYDPELISALNKIYKNNFKKFKHYEKWLSGHAIITYSRSKELYSEIPILFRMSDPSFGATYQIITYLGNKYPDFVLS